MGEEYMTTTTDNDTESENSDSAQSKSGLRFVFCVTCLNFMSMSLFSPLINKQMQEFDLSPFTIGIVGSIYGATQLLTIPFWSHGTEIYGARKMYISSIVATTLSNFAQVLTKANFVFVGARGTAGIFKHTTSLGKSVLMELVDRPEIPYATGHYNLFSNLGVIIGPILGGYLIQFKNSIYWICSSIVFTHVICFGLLRALPPKRTKDNDGNGNNNSEEKSEATVFTIRQKFYFLLGIRDKDFAVKLFITFCFIFANQTIRASFPIILFGKYEASVASISYLNSLQSITSALIGIIVRPVVSRYYNGNYRQVLIHAGVLHVISFICQVISPTLILGGMSILLLELACTFLWVATVGLIVECREKVAHIFMARDFVVNLAFLTGPACAGVVHNILGHNGAPGLGACASFLAVLCTTFLISPPLPAAKLKTI